MNQNNIEILKLIIDNTLTRFFLSNLGYCNTCQQPRMNVILDLYTGKRNEACITCTLTETILSSIFNKEIAQKMKEAGIKFVQISLDGSTPKSHDSFRGMRGMYDKAIYSIKNCVDQDFFVKIDTVATKNNKI